MARPGQLWAIILAGGAGSRLAALTSALHGLAVAKQFAVIVGCESLVQTTVERILPLVPEERIVVVVGPGQETSARRQLARWSGIELVAQPRDLGTGPGLLLPLAIVRARDKGARVVVLPADHRVARPSGLLDAIDLATTASLWDPDQLCLLGAAPEAPDGGGTWIVPGRSLDLFGLRAVSCVVENAPPLLAECIHRSGGVLRTHAMVASVERLWGIGSAHLSRHAAGIQSCLSQGHASPAGERGLEEAYASLWPVSFSRAMPEPGDLSVLSFSGAGWSDWDTPRQVFQSLKGSADLHPLLARLACATPSSAAAARDDAALLA